jgi:long-chain acyl-CoA synthetase
MTATTHSFSLASMLREHRRSHPLKTAVVCGGRRFLYPELDRRVNRWADVLRARGVSRGERVLWLGQNCHRLLESLLAAAKLGAILCPANWRQSADETSAVISDFDPAVVVWQSTEIGPMVEQARAASTARAHWIQHDAPASEDASYESLLSRSTPEGDEDLEVEPSSPLLVVYTAAFGGRSLGALISHEALLIQGLVTSKLRRIDGDYVYLNSGPLFHLATLVVTFATILSAGTNVFTRRVEAEEICRLIEGERCTGAFLMPPTMAEIVRINDSGRWDLKSLRSYAGTPEWNRMVTLDDSPAAKRAGGYGQTEVSGHLTFGALGIGALGSSGRPMPMAEVKIVDPDGREVEHGGVGEIVARGPTMMCGYWNRPEESAERSRGGWHHTRDLGRREEDGSISFVGPMSKLIKSAAENIYPAEVEACIRLHAAVKDCAVIGVPDPQWGQSVKAIVVLRDGASASAEEIIEHVRARIASYKKPRSVDLVDSIPRKGPMIDYDALDARFGGGGYPGARR